jgi:hypothetical protein
MSGKNPLGNGQEPQSYEGLNIVVPIGGWRLVKSTRAPTTNDRKYPIGSIWINQTTSTSYQLVTNPGIWTILGSAAGGDIQTLTGGSGGALLPTAGNMNLLGTANQITSTGSGSTITFSIPSAFTAPGSVTATTTLTATLGAITATNGNLVLGTAGNKIIIPTGANASVGTSSAMSGNPGSVTVSTTASSATAKIFYVRATTGGTPGNVSITAQDGTGFTLTSTSATETSTFNWWIINA